MLQTGHKIFDKLDQLFVSPIFDIWSDTGTKNFRTESQQFVEEMISPQNDLQLHKWILSDMSAAPRAVALSAMNNMVSRYINGEAAKIFDEIRIPVIAVNGDRWPVIGIF